MLAGVKSQTIRPGNSESQSDRQIALNIFKEVINSLSHTYSIPFSIFRPALTQAPWREHRNMRHALFLSSDCHQPQSTAQPRPVLPQNGTSRAGVAEQGLGEVQREGNA